MELPEFDIKFINLKLGSHIYPFHVNSSFFLNYENSLIKNVEADIVFILTKQNDNLFLLDFEIKGILNLLCDRCLKPINYDFFTKNKMVLKVVNADDQLTDENDIITVLPNEFKINIADYIYEFISLQLPMKLTCDLVNMQCDKNMIDVLTNYSVKGEEIMLDPRWEVLKTINNNQ